MKRQVSTDRAPKPGGPYSQAIITSGRTAYVAGQGPIDPATGKLSGETFEEQCNQTLKNLKAIVESTGASMADLVKLNAYLSDMSNFPKFNELYKQYIYEPFPVRTTVECKMAPNMMIQLDCIIALPD